MKRVLTLGLVSLCVSAMAAETQLDTITVEESAVDGKVPTATESLRAGAANDTLGGYLDDLPNVDSASYGEGVGRPVVRGMGGYRLKILHNDADFADLSAMSQDHAVAVAPRASQRIELLKGPASLLYAASAGGVIRLNDALDAAFPEPGVSGHVSADWRHDPNASSVDARLAVASDRWALRLGGLRQDADPYTAGDGEDIADSDVRTDQGQVGIAWQAGANAWQLNATRLEKDYGIPNKTPESTRINMERDDVGFSVQHQSRIAWLDQLEVSGHHSDYLHDETEGGRRDGLFGQEQQRATLSMAWVAGEWLGETRISLAQSELRVCHEHGACDQFRDASRGGGPLGESVLQYVENTGLPFSHGHPMPDTDTDTWQFSTVAESAVTDTMTLSLGLHGEGRRVTASPDNIQEQWVFPPSLDPNYYARRSDQSRSVSLGLAYEADTPMTWDVSVSYLERFPSVDELYWNGFHHATDSYIFGNHDLTDESSLNLDVDVDWRWATQQLQVSAFYYRFQDYIYQDIGYDDDGNNLTDPFHLSQVWFTRQTDADFLGGSVRYENTRLRLRDQPLILWAQVDVLDAYRRNGERLPRTAPISAEIGLRYASPRWQGSLSLKRVSKANKLAPQEPATSGYSWLAARLQRNWALGDHAIQLWIKGENLLDEEARNHLSFLKDTAPLPGRQVTLGVNWRF